MPATATVETLNLLSGKGTSSGDASRYNTRLRILPSDVYSPGKQSTKTPTGRSVGGLQKSNRPQPTTRSGRRSSLSLLDDDATHRRPPGRPKKKLALYKNQGKTKASPLKKHGNEISLKENPNVDLGESPAQNTRSKQPNPLQLLAQHELPPAPRAADKDDKEPKKGQGRRKTRSLPKTTPRGSQKRTREAEPDDSRADNNAKRARTRGSHKEQESPRKDGSSKRASDGSVRSEPETQQDRPTGVEQALEEHEPADEGQDSEHRQREEQEQDSEQAKNTQSAQVAKEREDEFRKCMESYIEPVKEAVELNGCKYFWTQIGGAAGMILARIPKKVSAETNEPKKIPAETDEAKAFLNSIIKIRSTYKEIQSDVAIEETKVSDLIGKLVDDDERNLQAQHNRRTDSKMIKDIYLHIIPRMVYLLRSFLLTRYSDRPLTVAETKELLRLLSLTIKICRRAREWEPRPESLAYGIRLWMRDKIGPNLRRIYDAFKPTIEWHDRIQQEREKISDLARRSKAAHRAFLQRLEDEKHERRLTMRGNGSLTRRGGYSTGVGHVSSSLTRSEQFVYDIDEIEEYSRPLPSRERGALDGEETGRASATVSKSRPRLVREPTIELLPPPAADLSEEEKIALLNGLQKYAGYDRYNDILDDPELGDVLRKQDLDTLMEAATSYSRMMSVKMGAEAYRADRSLGWLRSVDPDVGDGASVVL